MGIITLLRSCLFVLYCCGRIQSFLKLNADEENVKSSSFQRNAKQTYAAVINCLTKDRPGALGKLSSYKFPADAEEHYRDLYQKTAAYRQIPMHEYADYAGPWIENHWIKTFEHLPLSAFGGLIPIFVQWLDMEVGQTTKHVKVNYTMVRGEIGRMLRKNVLYVTLAQGANGLWELPLQVPNLLIINGGGYGHVPIPLVLGQLPYSKPSEFLYDFSFFGVVRNIREYAFELIEKLSAEMNLTFIQGEGRAWQSVMLHTRFNLAPRGYGKTSFRMFE
jgi:hypothetical protein